MDDQFGNEGPSMGAIIGGTLLVVVVMVVLAYNGWRLLKPPIEQPDEALIEAPQPLEPLE